MKSQFDWKYVQITCEPSPKANSIKKKRIEKNELAGICAIASGYVMNAKPGPDASAYFETDSFNSVDKYPMVANTAKPANTPVTQSHDTTMHICLLKIKVISYRKSIKITNLKKLLLNLFDAE